LGASMSGHFAEPPGATPLGPSEMAGLRQTWIASRHELDEAEQANIVSGLIWARRARKDEFFSEPFVMTLHKQMFGDVWEWAGKLRKRQTNIGVEPYRIPVALRELLGTARYWLEERTFQPTNLQFSFITGWYKSIRSPTGTAAIPA
jgi:Fic-DOC domain mobile mystery protein B